MIKKKLKSESGISLIEVLVAASLAVVVSMGVMRINDNASKGMLKITTDAELRDFQNTIENFLSNGNNCAKTFQGYSTVLNMKDGEATSNTNAGGVTPPNYTAARRFFEFSNNATMKPNPQIDLRIVTKLTSAGAIDSSITLTPNTPIQGAQNWTFLRARLYQMKEDPAPNNDKGLCALQVTVQRINGDAKRSYGSADKSFWIQMSCLIDIGGTKEVSYCSPTSSIQSGYWTLVNSGIPSNGIKQKIVGPVVVDNQNLEIRGTGGVIIDSDQRFKRDEQVIQDASKKLKHINGYYYYMRSDEFPHRLFSREKQIGVFAQEVESQFDGIVNTHPDGFKGVNYSKLIPVLIQAHKEQEKKIRDQQKEIDLLNQKFDQIMQEVNK